MTITPFLAVRLRGKKDALLARQRARRVAQLLRYDEHEQACIAAGAFMIACQALEHFGRSKLCFRIAYHQLQIFADQDKMASTDDLPPFTDRLSGLLAPVDPKTLYRLVKALPPTENAHEETDIAWLLQSVESTARTSIFEEIVRQNQEILALLHELRSYCERVQNLHEDPSNPNAA